jgi:acetate kinase
MGTRCGDLDPAVILHVMAREELSLQEANTLLNKHSGMQGISGHSSDMRDIIQEAKEGHANSKLALDIYCYRIKKYIGAYTACMGGLDALVFTAGIGENSPAIRERCCGGLEFLGIELDEGRNEEAVGVEALISKDKSKVKVFAIPTNEELVIAQETKKVIEVDKFLKEMVKGV